MKKHRKFLRSALLALLSLALVFSCAAPCSFAEAPAPEENADAEAFMADLAALDGICDVSMDENGLITAYIVQPLDWAGGTDATFLQKLRIAYTGADLPVCYCCGGYSINTSISDRMLFPEGYAYNAVRIEYRFFGDSMPEGLSADSAELWEYLTVENAAEDIHAVITRLGTLLTGKRVMTGVSKGGFTTNFQAYRHPEDAELFLPFCAPLCASESDGAMFDFLNNRVGDDVLGEETAAEVRGILLDFQLECIRYKDDLKTRYRDLAVSETERGEADYRPILMEDGGARFYDLAVADLLPNVWTTQGHAMDCGSVDGIRSVFGGIVSMPCGTAEEIAAKEDAIFDALTARCDPFTYSSCLDNMIFIYTMQSAMQMGNYYPDLTPLRQRIAEEQEKDPSFPALTVTEEEEKTMLTAFYLTEEQQELAEQFSFVHDELVEWEQTTEANVLMVFGGVDAWYGVAIPECGNPNVRRVVVKTGESSSTMGHVYSVATFDEASRELIYDALEALR